MSEKATEYEDFVFDLLRQNGLMVTRYVSKKYQYDKGECSGGIEVKFDDRMRETGNIYIEVAEKAYPDDDRPYTTSGIYRKDNSWLYVIGDYSTVYVFAKTTLALLHNTDRFKEKVTPTSRGFLIPTMVAGKYAARMFTPNKKKEVA